MSEKYVSPESQPTGVVAELLTVLNEECHEVGQRICKAQRFGLREIQKGQPLTNEQRIIQEYADLVAVVEVLQDCGVLHYDHGDFFEMKENKKRKLEYWIQNDQK